MLMLINEHALCSFLFFFITLFFKALRLYPASGGKHKLAGPLFNKKYVIMSAANTRTQLYYAAATFTVLLVAGEKLDTEALAARNVSTFCCTDDPDAVPGILVVPEVSTSKHECLSLLNMSIILAHVHHLLYLSIFFVLVYFCCTCLSFPLEMFVGFIDSNVLAKLW